MRQKQTIQLCALCSRPINVSNKMIRGIGKVGPECYSKYAGLESYIAQLGGKYFNYSVAIKHARILKYSGIRVRLDAKSENAYGSLYGIVIVGLLKQKYHQSSPESFSEYRNKFAVWLENNQQNMDIQAAA